MSNEKDRLDRVQAELKKRGFKDVKFFFGPIGNKPLSEVANEAANFLEAILNGRTRPLPKFGDSVRK